MAETVFKLVGALPKLKELYDKISGKPSEIASAVEGLKKAVIDNQNYIKNELSKEIAQKALDQDWMKINEWNNRLKDASVKLKDTGDSKDLDILKQDLADTKSGVRSVLSATHDRLVNTSWGDAIGSKSLLEGFVTPLNEPLCSIEAKDDTKGIAWYLQNVTAFLTVQTNAQMCGAALCVLTIDNEYDLKAFAQTMDDRLKKQMEEAQAVMPAFVRQVRPDLRSRAPFAKWRFEYADTTHQKGTWLTRGSDAGVWHQRNKYDAGTTWWFVSHPGFSRTPLDQMNSAYLGTDYGGSSDKNVIRAQWLGDLIPITSFMCEEEQSLVPILMKVAPVNNLNDALFRLVSVFDGEHMSADRADTNRILEQMHRLHAA